MDALPILNPSVLSNIGAVAELFDISCLYGTSLFKTIQDDMFDEWSRRLDSFTIQDLIREKQNDHAVLGQHYFIANGTAIAPKWDFTSASERGNVEAFTVGAKVGDLPVSGSVDWLSLDSVEGRLAGRIYRVDTKSGLPPTSVSFLRECERTSIDEYQCVAGSPQISVKYAAKYCMYHSYSYLLY